MVRPAWPLWLGRERRWSNPWAYTGKELTLDFLWVQVRSGCGEPGLRLPGQA